MTLPTSVQAAQTVAAAAKTLDLADQVRIQPTAAMLGRQVNVTV